MTDDNDTIRQTVNQAYDEALKWAGPQRLICWACGAQATTIGKLVLEHEEARNLPVATDPREVWYLSEWCFHCGTWLRKMALGMTGGTFVFETDRLKGVWDGNHYDCQIVSREVAPDKHATSDKIRMLEGTIKTANVRLGILLDRMAACEEDHPDTHRVTMIEVPAWIEEQKAVLEP